MTTTKHNWLMAGLTLSAAALVAAGAAFYFLSPAQRIALDVNPSIELETTRLEKVSKIIPLNDDAKKLLEGYTPKDNDLPMRRKMMSSSQWTIGALPKRRWTR